MIHNPYSYIEPAKGDLFCGRDEDVEMLVQRLIETPGQSFLLLGGRRIGKTSLLQTLYGRIEQIQTHSGLLLAPIQVSLKTPTISSLDAFFQAVGQQAQESLRCWLDLPATDFAIARGPEAPEVFARWLQDSARAMGKQRGRGLRLILLLDNCDSTAGRPWIEDLYSALHNLLDGALTGPHFKLVMAGSPSFVSQVYHRGSPLGNKLKSYGLRGLNDRATHELITGRMCVNLRPRVIQAIIDQSGGHPYLVQYLMQHLCDDHPEVATARTIQRFARKFLHERVEFEVWADDLGDTALRIYGVLTEAQTACSESQLRAALKKVPMDFTLALDALCYHGVIWGNLVEDRYQCAGQMFREWFREYVVPRLNENEPLEKPREDNDKPANQPQRGLREEIMLSFTTEELKSLCFDVGTDHEEIPGETKSGMTIGLITYFIHRKRLPDLLERLCRERPDVPWQNLPVPEVR